MPERFEKAARAGDSAKGLRHYLSRLQKARRRGNARKIAKFERKVQKYSALAAAAAAAAAPPRLPRQPRRPGPKIQRTSRFIGVSWVAARGKWKACVRVGKRTISIGQYDDEEVAARKYNEYVRRHDLGNQLNDVDANGKPLPTTFKRSSRFHGVSWHANRSECQWRAQYRDPRSTPAKTKTCHVGYYSDEEVAALAYNEAVIAAGLDHIRVMNRVDATGRPLPKDQ